MAGSGASLCHALDRTDQGGGREIRSLSLFAVDWRSRRGDLSVGLSAGQSRLPDSGCFLSADRRGRLQDSGDGYNAAMVDSPSDPKAPSAEIRTLADELVPLFYAELRTLARRMRNRSN